jgi:hypothetical protein
MSKSTSVRLDTDHAKAIGDMVEHGEADSPSEALRQTSQADLARRGYLNGSGESYWAWLLRRVGFAFMYAGLGAVALLYFLPVTFRIVAVVPLLSGLVCLAGSRAIDVHHREEVGLRNPFRGGWGQR